MGSEDRDSGDTTDAYLTDVGQKLFYEYDSGDAWGHVFTLEKFLVREMVLLQKIWSNGERV